jgi:nucleoside-diphosphate-sugar epimerase
MKFMEKSGEGTKLESVFRTFIQVRVSNDEFMSVDDLVDAIRKVEVDTEKKAERFDFGTGEIEKQE